ncbi:MAG: hypothetical protein CVU90_01985 [Firmicutes bacterium HGW-Firmicutes-15]|nr:MAG: hypothetical protein CVU90_01985 [Firmicutes bacterium HGW-Firmicutes-15]
MDERLTELEAKPTLTPEEQAELQALKAKPPVTDKTFTQAQLDDVITKRLAREKKAWEKTLEEEKAKAAMTETERFQSEKLEAQKLLADSQAKANQKLLHAEIRVQSISLGVTENKLTYLSRLIDITDPNLLDANGDVDDKAVKAAVSKILQDIPELASKTPSKGGSDFSAGNPKSITKEQFTSLSYKDRIALKASNPALYKQLTT